MPEKVEAKREYLGIEQSAAVPTGLAVGTMRDTSLLFLTFYWSPPEKSENSYVLFRAALDAELVGKLMTALTKASQKKEPSSRDKGETRPSP